ncbi:restriction endonuclease subunit S [Porifericola rhodea]|uniref:restriction endonuclease subunit S n=1 Tax=Porifericola rhodea TaxID=930972 RepID=UPI0026667F40|nr:restriction endonuclease subunit S [Porifericola rhodea]WKN33801.1 restriction endonuclease subunit S [Porifericola rhodea]
MKDMHAEGIAHVVGLEHIDPEDIHLRRAASIEDSTTFTKKFRKGDILFGRRRAYLKKAAQANFDGICSGDITVMRAKEGLLPKLLPFVVNNDKFFDYAVKHSAGGLSPRVKFRDLANYEFLLPPKEQQAPLAELLWAMDEVIEKDLYLFDLVSLNKKALFKNALYYNAEEIDEFFGKLSSKFAVKKIGSLITTLQYGISESLSEIGQVPILRMNNLQEGKLDLTDIKFYTPVNGELDNFILEKGDILFNRTNSYDLVGKVSLFDEDDIYSFASYLIRIKVDQTKLDPRYLNFYMNSAIGIAKIRKYRTPGVSQSNINAQNIKRINIPVPDVSFQKMLMDKIDKFEKSAKELNLKIESAKALQKSLINQIF